MSYLHIPITKSNGVAHFDTRLESLQARLELSEQNATKSASTFGAAHKKSRSVERLFLFFTEFFYLFSA
ncbi:MAG TPA: hypothetical protein DEA82_01840 [Flavobacteriaceae bacterium]|nr:hypothetical protein [Flavobacteriaceae bacterium]HBR52975.1 hypothetical protein [Flavobacteriaceae bacterium]